MHHKSTMPSDLRMAHQLNNVVVMNAYGFNVKTMTESKCVAELMKLYDKLIEEQYKLFYKIVQREYFN